MNSALNEFKSSTDEMQKTRNIYLSILEHEHDAEKIKSGLASAELVTQTYEICRRLDFLIEQLVKK